MDKPPEKHNLPDATVTIWRDVALKYSPTESGAGDRMLVQHVTGSSDDIVVIKLRGAPKLQRVVAQMEISSSSPAVPALAGVRFSLADLDQAEERRLLAIYNMFP
jgi:hypothetical protein